MIFSFFGIFAFTDQLSAAGILQLLEFGVRHCPHRFVLFQIDMFLMAVFPLQGIHELLLDFRGEQKKDIGRGKTKLVFSFSSDLSYAGTTLSKVT